MAALLKNVTYTHRTLFCVLPLLATSCDAKAVSYSGSPMDIALEACIDHVSRTESIDAIAQALAANGWSEKNERETSQDESFESRRARFGEYEIWYYHYPQRAVTPEGRSVNAQMYACYVGTNANDEAGATALVEKIKSRTGILDRVVLNSPEFGAATFKQVRFSQGPRFAVSANFWKLAFP